jgi:hypothetical protein
MVWEYANTPTPEEKVKKEKTSTSCRQINKIFKCVPCKQETFNYDTSNDK